MLVPLLFISLYLCGIQNLFAQNKPFPQNVNYANGFKATNISSSTINTHYTGWKSTYLITCPTGQRVEFTDPYGTTVSEGQGYGMVISAYMGDKTTYDNLYAFEKSKHNTYGNMGWKTTCDGFVASVGGSTSATDGDMDIAFSLCIASVQWGEPYTTDAKARIKVLKDNNFTYNTTYNRWIQEWRDGTTETFGNTSYWSPGLYRVFKNFSGDADWDAIINDTYDLLLATRNPTTGFNGNQVSVNATSDQTFVDYNGARSPWRYVIDYLWTGNTKAQDLTDKLTDWANTIGISNLVDGYKIDGTPTGGWNQSPPWTGAWACGAMSKDQSTVDKFAAYFNTCTYDGYYASSLRLLYELTLTGNYWMPVMTKPAIIQTPFLGTPVALPGKIEAENYDEVSKLHADKYSVIRGEGIAYHDHEPQNKGHKYRKNEGVDIKVCSEGGYNVGWTNKGEYLKYTVNPVAGNYDIEVRYAAKSDGIIEITFDNGNKTTGDISLPATGGWKKWATVTVKGINLNAGQQIMKLIEKSAGFNLNYIDFKTSPISYVDKKFEAEEAKLTGTNIEKYCSGYSGIGYVAGLDSTGEKLDFSVNVLTPGAYKLTIHYALCNDQYNDVIVNGSILAGASTLFPFNNTACCTWQDLILNINLKSGDNTITILKNWGYTSIDYINVSNIKEPDPIPFSKKYEAESAVLTGTNVDTSCVGYSGLGYVTGLDAAGDKIDFAVNVPSAGAYKLTIHYADCNDQYNDVSVNGALVGGAPTSFPFNNTNCCSWQDIKLNINLKTGDNAITILKNWGYTSIDYIDVSNLKDTVPSNYSKKYEAEDALLTGTNTETYCSGFSDKSYVSGLDSTGDKIDFKVNIITAGAYKLTIRYAVCNDTYNDVKVNGVMVGGASTSFPLNKNTGCCTWQDVTLNIDLLAGDNTITILKNWGYTGIDYINISSISTTAARLSSHEKKKGRSSDEINPLIYPNPSSQLINIMLPLGNESKVSLLITDMLGRIVMNKNIEVSSTASMLELDISHLKTGNYIVKAQRGDNSFTGRVQVEK